MSNESAASADLNKLRIDRSERREVFTRRRSPWPSALLLLLICGAAGGGYYYYFTNVAGEAVTTTRAVLVTPGESNALLTATGYVVAQKKAILGAKSPRRLVERLVNEGQRVVKDQIIARLDHVDVDARLAQAVASVSAAKSVVVSAEAAVARAAMAITRAQQELAEARTRVTEAEARRDGDEREWKRLVEAEKSGAAIRKDRELAETQFKISTASLDAFKQKVATAEIQVEWLRRDLKAVEAECDVKRSDIAIREAEVQIAQSSVEDTIIRAPFDGVILLKQAEVGESVSPGVVSGQVTSGSIFQIADFDTLEAEVDINESNVSKVREGQPCDVFVDAAPGRTFPGKVRILMPGANRQKATVAAKITFLETDAAIRPELGCKVTFLKTASETRTAPRLLIQKSAVRRDRGSPTVFTIQDGRATPRSITLGDETGDRVEVRSGLAEGEEIIQSPPAGLASGDRVRLKK